MFEFTTWHASFPDFFISLRHYTVIGKQLLLSNDRNRVPWAVLGLSQDGACIDLFENLSVNSLKGDLSNATTFKLPLFSLDNTFKNLYGTTELDCRYQKRFYISQLRVGLHCQTIPSNKCTLSCRAAATIVTLQLNYIHWRKLPYHSVPVSFRCGACLLPSSYMYRYQLGRYKRSTLGLLLIRSWIRKIVLLKFCVKIIFCKHYLSPLHSFIRKGKDPEP
jgi:hypothetical protein